MRFFFIFTKIWREVSKSCFSHPFPITLLIKKSKPISTATQNALDQKAPINSPIFTGIPEIKTSPDPEDSSQRIPSTNWVRGRIDESFNQVNSGLGDHVSDYQNPHRVTAEQVGTYDEHEIDDLLDNKADLVNGKVPSYQLPDSTISWIEVE